MASTLGTRWSRVVGGGVAVIATVTATCTSLPPQPDFGSIHECPQSWERLYGGREKGAAGIANGFALPGRITDVPEFHDCQKFLLTDPSKFGPLVAIFAAWDLEGLGMRADSGVGPLRPADPDKPSGGSPSAPGPGATFAAAGALIVNLEGQYRVDDFVIERGYNCLYLWRDPQWRARIVWVPSDSTCLQPIRPDTFKTPTGDLKVVVDAAPEFSRSDYPPVARWDFDISTRQQYIGIKCGQAWCEIGSHSFKPNVPYTGTFAAAGEKKTRRIKGWYDEQYLADTNDNGVLIPSTLKGTIIPDALLDTYVEADFTDQWAPVAYIALSESSPQYRTKLNLERAPVASPLNMLNRVALCHGTRAKCIGTTQTTPVCGSAGQESTKVIWWSRVTSAITSTTRYSCVRHMDHAGMGFHVPGTARWRWILEDETTWTRCIEGCCEIDNKAT